LAKTSIAYGFDQLKKKDIYALVRPSNTASIHVLEKCNFKLVDYFSDFQNEDPSLIYRIDASTRR